MDRIEELETEDGFEIYITSRPLLVRLNLSNNQIEIMPHVQDELLNDIEENLNQNQDD
jgi:hypothetical protein